MQKWSFTLTLIMTLCNLFITTLMEYATVVIGEQCPCMKSNLNWHVIRVYFAVSVLFLMFLLLDFYGVNIGLEFWTIMAVYTLTTVVFVVSGFTYLQNPSMCHKCNDTQFRRMLFIVTSLRASMIVVSCIAFLSWFGYVRLLRN